MLVVTERIPTVRSVSVGVWVMEGGRSDPVGLVGIAHLIEHMLFKGTRRRSQREIAIEIDAMGGQLDAFTAHEHACYYAKVLDGHLPAAVGLLADLVLEPRFDEVDLEREQGVVLEEIASVEDDPEQVLFEHFLSRFWPEHPLGRPILGNATSVRDITADDLWDRFLASYTASNLLVAAAGNLEHEEVVEQVESSFAAVRCGEALLPFEPPSYQHHLEILAREGLEQAHLYVAARGVTLSDKQRYVGSLLNALLGGSISSRLFQKIREEHGLAYSVYSSMAALSDAGYLWICAATRPNVVREVLELVSVELTALIEQAPLPEELRHAKDHVKGSLMLSLEDTFGRMMSLAHQEIYFGRDFALDEILWGIECVATEDINELAVRLLDSGTLSVGVLADQRHVDRLRDELTDVRVGCTPPLIV